MPSSEVKALLEEINRDLNLHLEFPLRSEQRGFLVDFPADGTPRPRFLGICSSRNNFNGIEYNVPAAPPMTDDQNDKSKETFDTKMMAVTMATKNKTTKRNKEQKKVDRLREMKGKRCQVQNNATFIPSNVFNAYLEIIFLSTCSH